MQLCTSFCYMAYYVFIFFTPSIFFISPSRLFFAPRLATAAAEAARPRPVSSLEEDGEAELEVLKEKLAPWWFLGREGQKIMEWKSSMNGDNQVLVYNTVLRFNYIPNDQWIVTLFVGCCSYVSFQLHSLGAGKYLFPQVLCILWLVSQWVVSLYNPCQSSKHEP